MGICLNKGLIDILIRYSIPEQSGADRRILIGKREYYMLGKVIDASSRRRFRLLYKYGLMKREDRITDFLYSITPQGKAIADLLKVSIMTVQ